MKKNSSFFCYFVTTTIQKKELFWGGLKTNVICL